MLFLEQGSKHPFVSLYLDETTGLPKSMDNVYLTILHFEEDEVAVVDKPPTLMGQVSIGEYYTFVELLSTLYNTGVVYTAKIIATDPDSGLVKTTEQQFQLVPEGKIGLLNRQYFAEGDQRAFHIDFYDSSTGAPKDMDDVTIQIVYYECVSMIPMVVNSVEALAETAMVQYATGKYVYCLTIDGNFPANTEFFVRYKGEDPTTGKIQVEEEIFSSFEPASVQGLQLYPFESF